MDENSILSSSEERAEGEVNFACSSTTKAKYVVPFNASDSRQSIPCLIKDRTCSYLFYLKY